MSGFQLYYRLRDVIGKYIKFIGPGIMVSVAYMDPGNYSTSVSGGANYQYKLLFAIFVSNLFAVLLQCLCVKLGSVTGLDLAENCRKHFPRWLNISLYVFSEIAIIATDLSEVVGTAIALEILFHIPLIYGVLLTVLDVLIILLAYKPESQSMRNARAFEIFVSSFVLLTVICFVLELTRISVPDKWHLFEGYLPSKEIITEQKCLYLALGILGATVMPHSLFLGSSLVKTRLLDYDLTHNNKRIDPDRPTIFALKYALKYSYAELIISLFLVATFVNSSILIVAGATLYGQKDADDADLLSIYEMLIKYVSPGAGLIFALAMLFSGQSAGIVCTMAGQIVSEGFIEWSLTPWLRRLVTRLIAIVPCILVATTMGRTGIADMLNMSQVVLSMILPFVSAPLIYFTSLKEFMQVHVNDTSPNNDGVGSNFDENSSLIQEARSEYTDPHTSKKLQLNYANSRLIVILSIFTWSSITFFNFYLIISFLLGADIHF